MTPSRSYRRGLCPIGVVLVVFGLNWTAYPVGLPIRSGMVGAGIVGIVVAFWDPRRAFRVRTLMAGVAAIGVVLGLLMMTLRRDRYLELSRLHENRGQMVSRLRKVFDAVPNGFPETTGGFGIPLRGDLGGPIHLYQNSEAIELASWHEALAAKYTRAAARPWASIEPDAPPPFDETTDRSTSAKAASKKGAR